MQAFAVGQRVSAPNGYFPDGASRPWLEGVVVGHYGPDSWPQIQFDGKEGTLTVAPKILRRVCEYCDSAPATGYVAAYRAHVCQPCYENYHGVC